MICCSRACGQCLPWSGAVGGPRRCPAFLRRLWQGQSFLRPTHDPGNRFRPGLPDQAPGDYPGGGLIGSPGTDRPGPAGGPIGCPHCPAVTRHAITVRQLLCHHSGLPAHRPYFMQLMSVAPGSRKPGFLNRLRQRAAGTATGRDDAFTVTWASCSFAGWLKRSAGVRLNRFLSLIGFLTPWAWKISFLSICTGPAPGVEFAATEFCPLRGGLLVGRSAR